MIKDLERDDLGGLANPKCPRCNGTGWIDTQWINPDSHMPEPDGERCFCTIDDGAFDESDEEEEYL